MPQAHEPIVRPHQVHSGAAPGRRERSGVLPVLRQVLVRRMGQQADFPVILERNRIQNAGFAADHHVRDLRQRQRVPNVHFPGQTDDARLVLANIRSAQGAGAVAIGMIRVWPSRTAMSAPSWFQSASALAETL